MEKSGSYDPDFDREEKILSKARGADVENAPDYIAQDE
jgi:hypothetical protein